MKQWLTICLTFILLLVFIPFNTSYGEEGEICIEQTNTPMIETFSATWCPYCLKLDEKLTSLYDSNEHPFQFLVYDTMRAKESEFIMSRIQEFEVQAIPLTVFEGNKTWLGYNEEIFDDMTSTIETWESKQTIELKGSLTETKEKQTITLSYDLKEYPKATLYCAMTTLVSIQDGVHYRNYVLDGVTETIQNNGEIAFSFPTPSNRALTQYLIWIEVDGVSVGNVWIQAEEDPFDSEKAFLLLDSVNDLGQFTTEKDKKRYVSMTNVGSIDATFNLSSDASWLSFENDYEVKTNRKKGIRMIVKASEMEPGEYSTEVTIQPTQDSVSSFSTKTFTVTCICKEDD